MIKIKKNTEKREKRKKNLFFFMIFNYIYNEKRKGEMK
jgi:hypothetical protein